MHRQHLPLARLELTARDLAGEADVVFSSAGTHAHTGHRMNPEMAATLPHLDATGFRSRRLTPAMLQDADLVLTAESIHRQHILDDFPQHHRKLFTLGQFAATSPRSPTSPGASSSTAVGRDAPAGPPGARHRRPLPARGEGGRRRQPTQSLTC